MESHEFHREVERPSLRAGKVQKEVHIVLVFVKRAERREIHAAGITVRDQVFTGSPGEFGLAVFYGDLKLYVPTVASALETLPVGARVRRHRFYLGIGLMYSRIIS